MQYLITFLEGIISFISPCMLPMLPVYISYFAVQREDEQGERSRNSAKTLLRVTAFVVGFTVVFTLLGLFAGTLGRMLVQYQTAVSIVCGLIVIVFGLSYLDVIWLPFFKGMKSAANVTGVFSAFLFGVIYSLSLTPCVGAFLGSALMLASSGGKALTGALLLLVYSLGLGIPFVLSALLLDKLGGAIGWIKKHYKVINTVCGIALIVIGIMMAFGALNALLSVFAR